MNSLNLGRIINNDSIKLRNPDSGPVTGITGKLSVRVSITSNPEKITAAAASVLT